MTNKLLLAILTFWINNFAIAQQTELLTNPGFTNGTSGWWAYGADITSNNGEVNFDISDAGTNPWDIQLGQGDLTLRQGFKYTLSWRAKRESGSLSFNVGLGEFPYTVYFADYPSGFDNNWQENSVQYIHSGEDVSGINLTINMGGSDADAVFDYIRLKEEIIVPDTLGVPDYFIEQSYTHPGNLEINKVPQFVCLSFDDNLESDGVEWLCEQVEGLENPNNVDVGLSFFFNSQFLDDNHELINTVNTYLTGDESPNEIGNHTYNHPHLEEGRTVDEWKQTIQQGMDTLANYTNSTLTDLIHSGFRAPYVELSEEMFIALNELGVRYDHSTTTYYNNENEAGWPYMFQSESMKGTADYLWKVPISELFVPDSDQELAAYGIDLDIESQIGGNRLSAGDYHLFEALKLNSSSILGLLKYNLDRSLSGNRTPFTFCFHSHYYSEERSAAIDANSNTTLQERQSIISSFIDYCQQSDEIFLTTISQMLDWMENPISPEILYKNPGAGPVSFYGEMQVNGNQIYGARTGTPVQVKGMSLFMSLWMGEKFWNSGTVNTLVDDWNIELIRAAVAVEANYYWDYGFLNPYGREKQLRFVDEVVKAAIARDIYVLIDYHSFEADEHPEAAIEFFSNVAQKYGEYDNVIFEIYNEPVDVSWAEIKLYAEQITEVIRQYSDNLIVVGTERWSSKVEVASLSPLDDDNTAYTYHFYSVPDMHNPHEGVLKALENGIALFATEWGNIYTWGENLNNSDEVSFANSDTLHMILDQNSISSANWTVFVEKDNPTGSSLFNHVDGLQGNVSFTGKNWDDQSLWTTSAHYVYDMFKEQAATALWRKAEKQGYNITYHLNGDYNGANPIFYSFNMVENILLDEPVKEGFLFEGWYTNSEFTGEPVTKIDVGSTGDREYFAKWSELEEIELLSFPNFELGTYDWLRYDDDDSVSVMENDQIIIHEPTENSAEIYDYHFYNYEQFDIREGYRYTLNWRAKRAAGDIQIQVSNKNNQYSFIFSDAAEFNDEWQEKTFVYDHNDATLTDARLTVFVGGNSSDVTFDYVSLKETLIPEPETYTITTEVTPTNAGTVSGGGTYTEEETVQLTASASEGFEFSNWTINNVVVSTAIGYSFTVTEDMSLIAVFEPVEYIVTANAEPQEGGNVSGAGTYAEGEQAVLTATTNAGFQFVNWIVDGNSISADEEYIFTVTEDINLTAVFEADPVEYTVTATVDPEEGGSVSGAGTYVEGEEAVVIITPNEGFQFVEWTVDGSTLSTTMQYSFTVAQDISLTAVVFEDGNAVGEYNAQSSVRVYPNPFDQYVSLTGLPENEPLRVGVYSSSGQLLVERVINNSFSIKIELSGLNAGIYFMHINGDQCNEIVKIVNAKKMK